MQEKNLEYLEFKGRNHIFKKTIHTNTPFKTGISKNRAGWTQTPKRVNVDCVCQRCHEGNTRFKKISMAARGVNGGQMIKAGAQPFPQGGSRIKWGRYPVLKK